MVSLIFVVFPYKITTDLSFASAKTGLFTWCGRWDLNPYGITIRPSNVRVCQFRHDRVLQSAKSIILT